MLVSLGVTAAAIITLLSTRPAPIEPTLREITQFITDSGTRDLLQKQGVATRADLQTALVYAENAEIRFIAVRNDQILSDSLNEFAPGESLPALEIIEESALREARPRSSSPPPRSLTQQDRSRMLKGKIGFSLASIAWQNPMIQMIASPLKI
jgi:hypothetical protein